MSQIAKLTLLTALIIGAGLVFYSLQESGKLVFNSDQGTPELRRDDTATLIFVGDVMLSRVIGNLMVKHNDWQYPFALVADELARADLTFGNLENPISSRGTKVGSVYSFRADPRSVEGLTKAGFDVLSIANNHIWDYGRAAFEDTLKVLIDNGISPVGGGESYEAAHAPVVREVKGTKIAFLAYTNLLPASLNQLVAYPGEEAVARDVELARSMADIVVVSFHWGEEYETKHNRYQERLAHLAIDHGADLVVGHHPHVAQEVEAYRGGYIAYSLGNFVFDQNFSPETKFGLLLEVKLKGKKLDSVTPHRVEFTPTYQPFLVAE